MAGATATAEGPKEPREDAGSAGENSERQPSADAGKQATSAAAGMSAAVSGGAGARARAEAGKGGSDASAAAGGQAAGALAQQPPSAAQPATTTACQPGPYSGTFTGSVQLIGLALSSVTGTIRAELELDASNDSLRLRDARIQGIDQSENEVTGMLTGTINCRTRELEEGKLEDGKYHSKNETGSSTSFSGTTRASYASDPPSATGTWQAVADDMQLLAGQGTWSLVFTGAASK